MRLYLYDDPVARGWAPLASTRPAGEILFGSLLLRERLERWSGLAAEGYLPAPGLAGFEESGAPSVVPASDVPTDRPLLLLSSRYVPPIGAGSAAGAPDLPEEPPAGGVRLTAGGLVVGWILPAGHTPSPALVGHEREESSEEGKGSVTVEGAALLELPGEVIETPWDLVERNAERTSGDLEALHGAEHDGPNAPGKLQGVERIGPPRVSLAGGVQIDPGVVLDTRAGPIHLAAGVHLHPFTYLKGPAFVGEATALLGGTFESLSVGPMCKLRGEISESVILGYSNKAHDGYLGHSLVGRWVNLGAFTTNSDLKNNYGSIRLAVDGREIDTGKLKVGVFLGDHVKTGIGTRMNAGTCVGAGSNLFGGGSPPKWVPPFSWGEGGDLVPYRLESFLETAERAMGRRNVALTSGQRAFFSRLWRGVHGLREQGAR